MDEASRLLERLRRIEALSVDGVGRRSADGSGALLAELRALVPEAEARARTEGDKRAAAAVSKLREETEGMR